MRNPSSLLYRALRLVCLVGFLATSVVIAADAPKKSFDVPAGDAGPALKKFAAQANREIMFPSQPVAGIKTNAVKGQMTPSEALDIMLAKTELFAVEDQKTGAYSIRRESSMEQAKKKDQMIVSRSANDNRTSDLQQDNDVVELSDYKVSGSRIPRSPTEYTAPTRIFDRKFFAEIGASTIGDVLKIVPENQSNLSELPEFNIIGATAAKLRGLSSSSTLVLVNGRRTAVSGVSYFTNIFDLNIIPLELVERVDVVTDSASAIYGGDAVAGVINIILRENFDGVSIHGRYANTFQKDSSESSIGFAVGGATDRLKANFVATYFRRNPLFGRDVGLTSDLRRLGLNDFGSTIGALPGNVFALPGQGNLPGLSSTFAAVPTNSSGIGLTPQSFAATQGTRNTLDTAKWLTVVPESVRKGFSGALQLKAFKDVDTKIFSELTYTNNSQIGFTSPPFLFSPSGGAQAIPASNAFNPFGVPVGVSVALTDAGPRINAADSDAIRGLLGIRGDLLGQWRYEAAGTYYRDISKYSVPNSLYNSTALASALSSSDPQKALNVFADRPVNSPTVIAALFQPFIQSVNSSTGQIDINLSGPISLQGRHLGRISFGAEHRQEKLLVDALSSTATHLDLLRDASAAFLEGSFPLWRRQGENKNDPIVGFDVAMRYDKYSDFGTSTNAKLGLRITPNKWVTMRATWGSSFRPPTLFELRGQPVQTFPSALLDPKRGNALSSLTLIVGSNDAIQPETAHSISAGFTVSVPALPTLSLTTNYYHISQDGLIKNPSSTDLLSNEAFFASRVTRANPSAADLAANQPGPLVTLDLRTLNFGNVTTDGIDLELKYTQHFSSETAVNVFANGTYVRRYDVVFVPGQAPQARVNTFGFPVHWRAAAGANLMHDSFSAGLTTTYVGSHADVPAANRTIPQYLQTDAVLSYDFGDRDGGKRWLVNTKISMGLLNIFDRMPSLAANANGFDISQTPSARGRFGYVDISKKF